MVKRKAEENGEAKRGPGRPKKEPVTFRETKHTSPLDFLLEVMNDGLADLPSRIAAARAAAQYVHTRKGDAGKKEERDAKAKEASKRFKAAPPPNFKQ